MPAIRPMTSAPNMFTVPHDGGDRDQTGDDARSCAERRGVSVTILLDEQPAE